jgi:Mg/Co/Ni transporter MgtE
MEFEKIKSCIESSRYAELKALLENFSTQALALDWQTLNPLEKLIIFKLLPVNKMIEVYDLVDYSEKYFLFCGLGSETIAPILEPLSDRDLSLFVEPPKVFCDRMFKALSGPVLKPGPSEAQCHS